MDKFCLAMDNYFTLLQLVKYLRNNGIGVVGTARMRKWWLPTGLRKYLIDEHGTLVEQWMDNGLVLLVSTLHKVGNRTLVNRRRPRVTINNRWHVDKV
eukprot:12716318-Ditylum_brightwellii.AAC.1